MRLIILASVLLSCPAFAAPRLSADGETFPNAVPRAFQGDLPLIRDKIGMLPEDLGGKVFNTKKSDKLLGPVLRQKFQSEWFVRGFAGSDVAGFDLTDGRISRIVWVKNWPSMAMVDSLSAKLAKSARPNEHCIDVANQMGHSLPISYVASKAFISFTSDPLEWYLLHHPPEKSVADAMRSKNPAKGITIEQASMTFGKPISSALEGDVTTTVWEERKSIRRAGFIGSSDDVYRAMQNAILNPAPTHVVRRVVIVFKDGVAVRVSDEHFE